MGLILLNGTAYSGYDEPPCVYSEEEREIGVWTDGKPLYQKTYHIEPTSTSILISISSLNIDKVGDLKGIWRRTGNNRDCPLFPRTESNNYPGYGIRMWIDYDIDKLEINIDGYSTSSVAYMDVTIQYTKTIDIPGSGKWASNGALAKHYSLQEQVIGTWIDGKPIYEITFDFYDDIDWNISYSVWNGTGKYIQNCGRILKATCSSNSGVYTEVMAYSDSDHIKVQTPRNGDTTQCRYLTIQYTKTTD